MPLFLEQLKSYLPDEIWSKNLDEALTYEENEKLWEFRLNEDFPNTVLQKENQNFKDFYREVYDFEYTFSIPEAKKLQILFAKLKQDISINWDAEITIAQNNSLSKKTVNRPDNRGYTLWDWYSYKHQDNSELLAKMYRRKIFPRTACDLVWAVICRQSEIVIGALLSRATDNEKTQAWLKALYTKQTTTALLIQEQAHNFDNELLIIELRKAIRIGQEIVVNAILPLVKIEPHDYQLAISFLETISHNFSSIAKTLKEHKNFPFPFTSPNEEKILIHLIFINLSSDLAKLSIIIAYLLEENLLQSEAWEKFIEFYLFEQKHSQDFSKIIQQIILKQKEALNKENMTSFLRRFSKKGRISTLDLEIIKALLTYFPSEEKQSLVDKFFDRQDPGFHEFLRYFTPSPAKALSLIGQDRWYRDSGFGLYPKELIGQDYLDQILILALEEKPINILSITYLMKRKFTFSETLLNTLWDTLLVQDPRQFKVEEQYTPLDQFWLAIVNTNHLFSEKQIDHIYAKITILAEEELDDFLWFAKDFPKKIRYALADKAKTADQRELAKKINPKIKLSSPLSTTFFNQESSEIKKTVLQNELANLKTAVIDAQNNYENWYEKKEGYSELRGGRGFFTWLRHGPDGQKNAVKFKNSIINEAPNLQTARTLIQNLLTDNKTRYHRHSFASFLIDELAKIDYLQVKADKTMLYDEEKVKEEIKLKR